jgi:pimeloyl-ACP methyl ester carboxylesterase
MTLVLLHSAGATASVWDPVLPFLTGVDVLVPTLPGRPGGEEAATDMAGCARAVLGAMDAAGLERATVTGHSLGGAVALWMALSSPTRVAGLGLISTGARLRVLPSALEALQDGLRGVIDGLVNAQFGPAASDRDRVARRRQFESVGAETTLADLRACDGFDVMDRLWEVRCRTQVLVGSEDVLTPPAYSRLLADRISAGRLTEYPGAGHMLLWERPAEVAGELAVLWAATADRRPVGAAGDGDGGAGARPISAREAPRT